MVMEIIILMAGMVEDSVIILMCFSYFSLNSFHAECYALFLYLLVKLALLM